MEDCNAIEGTRQNPDKVQNFELRKSSKNEADIVMVGGECDSDVLRGLHNANNESHYDTDWSEMEKTQRKMCLKLNLSKEVIVDKNNCAEQYKENSCSENIRFTPTEKINIGVAGSAGELHRRTSLDSGGSNSKFAKTPSSIPRDLIEQSYTASPSLARSPAMHEGFRSQDWRVERTPINTPDSETLLASSRLPQLSDDEEEPEDEDTDSLHSETDPISKGSATSSFLPSSIDVSESRTGSFVGEKEKCTNAGQSQSSGAVAGGSEAAVISSQSSRLIQAEDTGLMPTPTQDATAAIVAESGPAPAQPAAVEEETSIGNLVKPPAGFTDSPVRNPPPPAAAFLPLENIDDSVNEVFRAENEILILEPPKNVQSDPQSSFSGKGMENCEALGSSESKTLGPEIENFSLKESYHHPELVICQRQGIF